MNLFISKYRRVLAVIIAMITLLSCISIANAATKKRYIGTTTDNVKVRKGPHTEATPIGSLPKGAVIELVASVAQGKTVDTYTADKNFYKLSSGGFIAASYVKVTIQTSDENSSVIIIPTESATPEPSDEGVVVVSNTPKPTSSASPDKNTNTNSSIKKMTTISNVNVRALPTTAAQIIAKLIINESVTVAGYYKTGDTVSGISVTGKWYKLNTGGYVSADFLKEVATASNNSVITKTTTYATAIADATMYTTPIILGAKNGTLLKGESKIVTGTYKNGETVGQVKSVVGTWYKLSNGLYIQGSKVSLTTKQDTSSAGTIVPKTTNLAVGDGVTAKTNVNLRTGPGVNYGIKRLMVARETDVIEEIIKDGATIEGKKVEGVWAKLLKSDGYVRVDYLTFDASSTLVVE